MRLTIIVLEALEGRRRQGEERRGEEETRGGKEGGEVVENIFCDCMVTDCLTVYWQN